jgi:hypothetical protein
MPPKKKKGTSQAKKVLLVATKKRASIDRRLLSCTLPFLPIVDLTLVIVGLNAQVPDRSHEVDDFRPDDLLELKTIYEGPGGKRSR